MCLFTRCRQMDPLPTLLALCEENPTVTIVFFSKKASNPGFDGFFYVSHNKMLNKQSSCWWLETPRRSCYCNKWSSSAANGLIPFILPYPTTDYWFTHITTPNFQPLTPNRARTEWIRLNIVNFMAAEALASCVARTSASIILTV